METDEEAPLQRDLFVLTSQETEVGLETSTGVEEDPSRADSIITKALSAVGMGIGIWVDTGTVDATASTTIRTAAHLMQAIQPPHLVRVSVRKIGEL